MPIDIHASTRARDRARVFMQESTHTRYTHACTHTRTYIHIKKKTRKCKPVVYYCNIKYEIRPKSRLYFFYTPFYTARLLNLFTNAERFYIVVFVNDTRARIHLFIAFKDIKTKKRKKLGLHCRQPIETSCN